MPVNSISSSQSVQQAQSIKKSDTVDARKQADIRSADRVKQQNVASDQDARIEKAHIQQQAAKPTVNTSGQKVGTRINTAA